MFMNMTGRQNQFRNIVLGAAVVNLTANLLLIPQLGLIGAVSFGGNYYQYLERSYPLLYQDAAWSWHRRLPARGLEVSPDRPLPRAEDRRREVPQERASYVVSAGLYEPLDGY